MSEQNGDKTQDPTPRRRQQARQEGRVAKSQDLGSAVLLLASAAALFWSGSALVEFLAHSMQHYLGGEPWLSADPELAAAEFHGTTLGLARHVLPIMGMGLLAAVAVGLAQVGFRLVPQRIRPDLGRIDPLTGVGRIFSLSAAARLGFGVFKIVAVAAVAFGSLYQQRETILGLTALGLPQIALFLAEVLLGTTLKVAGALLVLALVDYGFQRWKHEQDLKMTPQEVREEMRNLEGDPQVAARRKSVQRQLVINRLADLVPGADVVLLGAGDMAVAVRYRAEETESPVVVAKGSGVLSRGIRRAAEEHGVPLVEQQELAETLFREVEVCRSIAPSHYPAVAEILADVGAQTSAGADS